MSRNNFNQRFKNIAQGILPLGLELLTINGVWLHPVITEGGGFDNTRTMFGLTVPAAHGKSLYVQVSPKTEELLAKDNFHVAEFLQDDVRAAVKLWESGKATDHEHALANMEVL